MPISILIPLKVFGLGFIISIFIAFMIKGMLFTIRHFTKESHGKSH